MTDSPSSWTDRLSLFRVSCPIWLGAFDWSQLIMYNSRQITAQHKLRTYVVLSMIWLHKMYNMRNPHSDYVRITHYFIV